ncbi:bacteriohemerythrin [Magnetospira sp. QH-2]|uniref:bacteriohemerythrin n=1 Tax=Magnetospira sp. (strain QH-2) TaxID=1288970 RepID=UPI0003E80F08|nr:hemerythrin family protein [Magnetospira sp. QH-2]CCQ73682.1 putative Hemerythrin-like protein [Magnetospira sp. QH-2]
MAQFAWSEEYSVGIHSLDTDHDLLIGLIGQLQEAASDSNERLDNVTSILNAIQDYTDYHFSREEALMAACRYPELDEHLKAHAAIRRDLAQHAADISATGDSYDYASLFAFLSKAFLDHLLDEDKAYEPYMAARRDAVLQANEDFVNKDSHEDVLFVEAD